MGYNLFRKLFDPNYATKEVEAVREDSNRKLKKASNSADKLTRVAKRADVTVVIFTAAGGRHHGN